MSKFLNSAQAKAEIAAEEATERAEREQEQAAQVNDLRQAAVNLKDLLDATSMALSEAYATIQSQAIEIAMLQRRLAKKTFEDRACD